MSTVLLSKLAQLVYPVVGAGRRLVLGFLHIDLEAFAVPLILPVRHFVAHAIEERTAAEVEPTDQHATEMAEMADAVAGRAEGTEKFDGGHDGDEGSHGDHDGEREEPDLAIREEDGVGNENAKDCARGANCGRINDPVAPQQGHEFHQDRDDAGTDSTEKKVVGETLLAPDKFQFAPKHPEHKHVDEQVQDASMKEKIGDWLPQAKTGDDPVRNKSQMGINPEINGRSVLPGDKDKEILGEVNAGASENEILDGWSDEAAPIEANARGAERRTHESSVRRGEVFRQKRNEDGEPRMLAICLVSGRSANCSDLASIPTIGRMTANRAVGEVNLRRGTRRVVELF